MCGGNLYSGIRDVILRACSWHPSASRKLHPVQGARLCHRGTCSTASVRVSHPRRAYEDWSTQACASTYHLPVRVTQALTACAVVQGEFSTLLQFQAEARMEQ